MCLTFCARILLIVSLWLQVFGLGFVSVFDQVLEGLPEQDKEGLFKAYIAAMGENSDTYRKVCFRTSALPALPNL
jgi:hypothetical protein